jgi:hypothetical protein
MAAIEEMPRHSGLDPESSSSFKFCGALRWRKRFWIPDQVRNDEVLGFRRALALASPGGVRGHGAPCPCRAERNDWGAGFSVFLPPARSARAGAFHVSHFTSVFPFPPPPSSSLPLSFTFPSRQPIKLADFCYRSKGAGRNISPDNRGIWLGEGRGGEWLAGAALRPVIALAKRE